MITQYIGKGAREGGGGELAGAERRREEGVGAHSDDAVPAGEDGCR
jgi:hypothetical protein